MTRGRKVTVALAVATLAVSLLIALRTFTLELAALWGGLKPGEPGASAFANMWDYFWTGVLAPLGLLPPHAAYGWRWFSWLPPLCIGFALVGLFISRRRQRAERLSADTPLPLLTWCSMGVAGALTLILVVRLTELGVVGPFDGSWLDYNVPVESRHFILRAIGDITMLAALSIWLPPIYFAQYMLRTTRKNRWVTGYYAALTAIAMTVGLIIRQWHNISEAGRLLNISLCLGAGGPPSSESLTTAAHASVGILYVGMAVVVVWTVIAVFCALRASHGSKSTPGI